MAQLVAVHGKAIRTSPGVCLKRSLAVYNGAQVRGSLLGPSPDKSMQEHIPDGSPAAVHGFCGAAEALLEASEDEKESKLGLTTSDAGEEGPPPPPAGASKRPRQMSPSPLSWGGGSEVHNVVTHGLENDINWI